MAPTIAFNGHILASAFQPLYGVKEGRSIGYEGLVRATGSDGRPVRAARLFESLPEDELISLDRTCRTLHLRSFASLDPGTPMLFLNLDPRAAVAEAQNVRAVRSRIQYFGLTPARVCFEILEGACADEGLLVDSVAAYREMGLAIAMDDFGVARSNFDRVAALRPDFVKLDRTLLSDAVGDARARRMLPSVIAILHATGTKVVIEGIEDASAALVAIEAGADYLQGYHLAMPGPGLPDHTMSERIMKELVRVRARAPAVAASVEAIVEAPPGGGAIGRLLGAARRSLPTLDSLPAYRVPPVEAVE